MNVATTGIGVGILVFKGGLLVIAMSTIDSGEIFSI